MKTQHTKTPWEYKEAVAGYSIFATVPDEPNEGHKNQPIAFTQWANHEANASFIVRAVNAHDDLVDACIEALSLFDNYPETNECIGTLEILNAAIAKARGAA